MKSLSFALAAGCLTLAVASPASAQWSQDLEHPRFWDVREDRLDRIESRIDERYDRGPLDVLEDRLDRREGIVDRRTDRIVTPYDRWGWRHPWR